MLVFNQWQHCCKSGNISAKAEHYCPSAAAECCFDCSPRCFNCLLLTLGEIDAHTVHTYYYLKYIPIIIIQWAIVMVCKL